MVSGLPSLVALNAAGHMSGCHICSLIISLKLVGRLDVTFLVAKSDVLCTFSVSSAYHSVRALCFRFLSRMYVSYRWICKGEFTNTMPFACHAVLLRV
jgi:hypothetical protein